MRKDRTSPEERRLIDEWMAKAAADGRELKVPMCTHSNLLERWNNRLTGSRQRGGRASVKVQKAQWGSGKA